MNAEKKVFSRLFTEEKTELATQKIELGLAQDLLQQYKKGVSLFTDAESTMDRALGELLEADKMFLKLEGLSKELGVDVDSTLKKLGVNLKSFIKDARK